MSLFKIGTLADWFGVGLRDGIRTSQRIGAEGVQLYATGELDPGKLTQSEIAEIRALAGECGQQVTALCGELGGHGLMLPQDNPQKIAYLKKTLELAHELDCNVVTTHIGVIPENTQSPAYAAMLDACGQVGAYAKSLGAYLAVETGPEPVARLVSFIRACGGGVAINYDPANLVGVLREDEVAGVYAGSQYIVHTHAKDSVNLNKNVTAEAHYGAFATGGLEAARALKTCEERPLGQGSVRWGEYLTALKDEGYRGFLTIEREVSGSTTLDDIAHGVTFLQEWMEKV